MGDVQTARDYHSSRASKKSILQLYTFAVFCMWSDRIYIFIILLLCALTPNSTEYINAFLSWRAVHVIIKQTQVSGVSDRCWPGSHTEAAKSLVVSREFTPQAKWLQRLGGGFSRLRLSFFAQLAANNIDKTPKHIANSAWLNVIWRYFVHLSVCRPIVIAGTWNATHLIITQGICLTKSRDQNETPSAEDRFASGKLTKYNEI